MGLLLHEDHRVSHNNKNLILLTLGTPKHGNFPAVLSLPHMNTITNHPERAAAQFLQIAGQGAGLATHADLWRWLQGDVQQWLTHDAMLVGWGDFRSGELQYDI